MIYEYARISNGKFTGGLYTTDTLSFSTTLEDIVSAGDIVVPLSKAVINMGSGEEPVYRDPLQSELDNKVDTLEQATKPIYTWELGASDGVPMLDANMEVIKENLSPTTLTYMGKWNALTNTPFLTDGSGNVGERYEVSGLPDDLLTSVELGVGNILSVRNGNTISYREYDTGSRWVCSGDIGLSESQKGILETAIKSIKEYELRVSQTDIVVDTATPKSIQLSSPDNPRPEYMILDNGGLPGIKLGQVSGELRLDATNSPVGKYVVVAIVTGTLGRSLPVEIGIDVVFTPPHITLDAPWDVDTSTRQAWYNAKTVISADLRELTLNACTVTTRTWSSKYKGLETDPYMEIRINGVAMARFTLKGRATTEIPETIIPVVSGEVSEVEIWYYSGQWDKWSTSKDYGYIALCDDLTFTYAGSIIRE